MRSWIFPRSRLGGWSWSWLRSIFPLAIDNARTFVRERATKHGINLDVTVDERLGDFVGDERKIKQILLNLLSNAVKFTPEGGRIGINARQADGSVEISVSDTGIGIAPEDQPKIFEEFRQVGSDYAHKVEGTGLGLTLGQEVCRTAWRKDLGGERGREGLYIHLYLTEGSIARLIDGVRVRLDAVLDSVCGCLGNYRRGQCDTGYERKQKTRRNFPVSAQLTKNCRTNRIF